MFKNFQSISFSKPIQHNSDGKVLIVDNDSTTIVYAVRNELVLENPNSNERTRYICDHSVDFISLSPDSELICCGMCKHNLIQVWSFVDSSWRCKISEGFLEISSISWAPDSRHLLVCCENNLKITIWSFVSTEVTVIDNPKLSKGGFSFSHCSKYMAVLERRNLNDYVGIYACDSWQLLKCFQIKTDNAASIEFSPLDLTLSITTVLSDECKALFYSIDGRLLGTCEKNDGTLGTSSLLWTPYNTCVIFNDSTKDILTFDGDLCRNLCTFLLPECVGSLDETTNIYRMMDKQCNLDESLAKYEIVKDRPFDLSSCIGNRKTKNNYLKSGVQFVQLSHDGQYAAILYYSFPNVLCVLDLMKFSNFDIIIQNSKIKSVKWHPSKHILVFISGSNNLNMWTPTSCINLVSPYENEIFKNVDWFPKGESLILNGKDCSAILYLP